MLELHLLGIAGLLIHYTKQWVSANKKEQEFKLKNVIPMAILSLLTTSVLIHLKDDIASLYPITRFSALVLGYFGNSIFFSLVNTQKPKFENGKLKS